MSIYIVSAGHGFKDPGASNPRLGLIEHLEAYQIAWHLRTALEAMHHTVEFVSCFQILSSKIAAVNKRACEIDITAAVEIHFNSAEDQTAGGTEVLHFNNPDIAETVSASVSAALKTTNRGAKQRSNLGWLNSTKPLALIVEVLFISNDTEATMVLDRDFHRKVASAIANGLTQVP